ncbi:MAG TPA: ATP-binding cassette domain-containing protein [Acidimicrobiia bacterium]|nr:ATP-binding cassette domain-containing protein [Acidimicrobiia bacterium]
MFTVTLRDEVPALRVSKLEKSYGPVRALRGASFDLYRGEVLALVGDNGAGKSTLVKCIAGDIQPDDGVIEVDGVAVRIDDPQKARALGIETVHQDLALVEGLDIATNLFLNRELLVRWPLLRQLGFMDKQRMYRETTETLARLHIRVPLVRQTVDRLSGGQRQSIAVGKAVAWGRHIVLLDEPSAALGVEQSRLVLDLIVRLRDTGVAVLLISHNMQQVIDVCDRAVVLRHGEKVGDVVIGEVTARDLVDLITGARAEI